MAQRKNDSPEQALLSRLSELSHLAQKRGRCGFSSFLSEGEQELAKHAHDLSCGGFVTPLFLGGHEDAGRRVFAAVPVGQTISEEELPFVGITLRLPRGYAVSHREVLGTLMGEGLTRDAIGDILIGEQVVVIFLLKSVAGQVRAGLQKIGRVGVKLVEGIPEELPPLYRIEACGGVVTSLRLDCVVSLVANVSRSESAKLISAGLVQLNSLVLTETAREVKENDLVSVRKIGKFRIGAVQNETRKGRLHLAYQKYI